MRTLRIFFFAIFSVSTAILVAAPAQAKFGLFGGYRYANVSVVEYGAHVVQLDFKWTLPKGRGYREGGKRPYHTLGFALALGGDEGSEVLFGSRLSYRSFYFALPLVYEYVFPGGLGLSLGFSVPLLTERGDVEGSGYSLDGFGVGVSNLGISQHFSNGLVIYAKTDLGYSSFRVKSEGGNSYDDSGFMWSAGGGLGYWF